MNTEDNTDVEDSIDFFVEDRFSNMTANLVSIPLFSILVLIQQVPCSTKILREFYFADWRFFVVCGNKFLRVEKTEISTGN